uniref:Pycsar effector protein domain-containing protein n=1 Tax=Candidatus Kentrum sp. LPFa TaxID=2126335 RepID=A0A450W5J7_9GAMM|nr:MAG: hypothetical protein BECKLPF1236B_GA0070989_103316 [Candidatus Kentron sp. LPFa]
MGTETRQLLENMLGRVIDMVKYAEAKHAILIGFAGASIFGFSKLFLPGINTANIFLYIYYFTFVAFSGLAILISLFSFLPILGNELSTDNSVYFGHAAQCDPDTYMKEFEDTLKNGARPGVNHLIAEEIVVNSKIAARKFKLFKYALACFISAALTPVASLILWSVAHIRTKQAIGLRVNYR